jgi:hypothetical protein
MFDSFKRTGPGLVRSFTFGLTVVLARWVCEPYVPLQLRWDSHTSLYIRHFRASPCLRAIQLPLLSFEQ